MKNIYNFLSALLLLLTVFSCRDIQKSEFERALPEFMVWDMGRSIGDSSMTEEDIEEYLTRLNDNNIKALFLEASTETYRKVAPVAKRVGIQLHTWRPTMSKPDKDFMEAHKDWYTVSKNNESCVDKPPYVPHYRWLCPNEPKVVEYLVNDYLELANIDGVTGIHLDFIRYCDQYLPVGLQPKYNLVQDHEMPEYDYCYCSRCREGFKKEYGLDPLTDSVNQQEWLEWRLKAIVNVANTISEEVKKQTGKLVTAAVFPTPKIAVHLVRQDWSKFKIDAVFPMIYNGFYNEDIDWIGKCVKEGIETMEYKKDLCSGVFVNHIKEPEQFKKAIKISLDNGAKGVVFFAARNLTDEHLKIIKEYK